MGQGIDADPGCRCARPGSQLFGRKRGRSPDCRVKSRGGPDCGIETFKALRNREKREHGEYRTQRLVLDAWNRFERDGTFAACGGRRTLAAE